MTIANTAAAAATAATSAARGMLKKLLIAGVAAGSLAAISTPASAITVKNCTGEIIRVNIYNNNDTWRAIPKFGGALGPGDSGRANAGSPRAYVKIFKAGIIDKLKIDRGGLSNGKSYVVRRGYRLAVGKRC